MRYTMRDTAEGVNEPISPLDGHRMEREDLMTRICEMRQVFSRSLEQSLDVVMNRNSA